MTRDERLTRIAVEARRLHPVLVGYGVPRRVTQCLVMALAELLPGDLPSLDRIAELDPRNPQPWTGRDDF